MKHTCDISKFLKFRWINLFQLSANKKTGDTNQLEPALRNRFCKAEVPVNKINS